MRINSVLLHARVHTHARPHTHTSTHARTRVQGIPLRLTRIPLLLCFCSLFFVLVNGPLCSLFGSESMEDAFEAANSAGFGEMERPETVCKKLWEGVAVFVLLLQAVMGI